MSIDFDPLAELLTIAEVAEILRLSISSVRRLQQQRLIPFYKVGGSVRLHKHDVISYLAKQRVEPIE
jgi:excisionase family DNA binding protein